MMDKNIYDLLNEVEVNLEEYRVEDMSEFEQHKNYKKFKEKIKMKNNKDFMTKKITAAVAVGVLAFGSIGVIPTIATTNPTLYKISDFLGIKKDLASYESIVDQSVTKEGITMRINEVIVDYTNIYVSVIITSEVPLTEDNFSGIGGRIHINGQEINQGSTSELKRIDEYTSHAIITFPQYQELAEHLKGELDIKITLTSPFTNIERSPHWNYEFNARGEELQAETKVHEINKVIEITDGASVKLGSYRINKLGDRLEFKVDGNKESAAIGLKGVDQDGKSVAFDYRVIIHGAGEFKPTAETRETIENAEQLTLMVYVDQEPVGESFVVNR